MGETFTRAQVASQLELSEQTIYRWEKDGKVTGPRRQLRTKKCLYTSEDVDRLRTYRDAVVEPEQVAAE